MSKNVIIKILFTDAQGKELSLIGVVPIKDLFSGSEWITISTDYYNEGTWQKTEHTIHKGDIQKLIMYKEKMFFTYDKELLYPSAMITTHGDEKKRVNQNIYIEK